MNAITITFPNQQTFRVPLQPIRDHRLAWYMKEDPNSSWWKSAEHQRPGVIALWPKDQMRWEEVARHCTPQPPRDPYFTNCWNRKKAVVKLKM